MKIEAEFKLARFAIIILVISTVLIIITELFYRGKRIDKIKSDMEISGVVTEIKIFGLNNGLPSYKINGEWHLSDRSEWYLHGYVFPGDSLFKKKGTILINLYRKNSSHQYVLIK